MRRRIRINYTIILYQKTFIAILIEKLVHAKHHKNHNNIQECRYKTEKKSRRRMLGEAGSGPPQ